jgi:hypothetical protein
MKEKGKAKRQGGGKFASLQQNACKIAGYILNLQLVSKIRFVV